MTPFLLVASGSPLLAGPGSRPCRGSVRWGTQFHAHLIMELGVGHRLGLLSGPKDFTLQPGLPGIAPRALAGQTGSRSLGIAGLGVRHGSDLIRAAAAGSGQTPEENGVGAAANDAENGQTHAEWTVGEAHRRLPEMCLMTPWHLS